MSHPLSRYSVNDFDNFDCLKVSWLYHLTLLFLLKGYAVALLSVSNMRDKLAFIKYVYPDPQTFYSALISGIPGVLLFALLLARRPTATEWVKRLWPSFYRLLATAVVFDVMLYWAMYLHSHGFMVYWSEFKLLLFQSLVAAILLLWCRIDHRARYNLREFPKPIEQTKSTQKAGAATSTDG